MFSRSLILAGALATALGPMAAAPARAAEPADVAKIVGSIAVLYMVGRAVSKARADDDDDDDTDKDEDRAREVRVHERHWSEGRSPRGAEAGRGWQGDRYERGWPRDRHGWDERRGRRWDDRWDDRSERGQGRHGARKGRTPMTLPASCQRTMRVRHEGPQYVMAPGCLARAGYEWRDLPRRCSVTVRARNGLRQAYQAHCLKRAGYRIGR